MVPIVLSVECLWPCAPADPPAPVPKPSKAVASATPPAHASKPSKAAAPERAVAHQTTAKTAGKAASQAGKEKNTKDQSPALVGATPPPGAPAAEEAAHGREEGTAAEGAVDQGRSKEDAAASGEEAVSGAGEERGGEGGAIQLRDFTIDEIRRVTCDLRKKLGQGGFGPVFYGRLPLSMGIPCNSDAPAPSDFGDGPEVAVKVLKQGGYQGKKEWEVLPFTLHCTVDLFLPPGATAPVLHL